MKPSEPPAFTDDAEELDAVRVLLQPDLCRLQRLLYPLMAKIEQSKLEAQHRQVRFGGDRPLEPFRLAVDIGRLAELKEEHAGPLIREFEADLRSQLGELAED